MVKEEGEADYWNRKWRLREAHLHENVALDGSDGEDEFDEELLKIVRDKEVLDIGCGPGEFTLRVARRAKHVVGIDSSETALRLAKQNLSRTRLENIAFLKGKAERLQVPEETYDVVFSRRGPASDSRRNLSEVRRVLTEGGTFMEICIGERDKQNIAGIFGRGQMLGFVGQVSSVKRSWLEEVGFREARSRDYMGTEVFRSIDDLIVRLRTAPIIPSFDARKDGNLLETVETQCSTDRGIETPVHRVILIGRK